MIFPFATAAPRPMFTTIFWRRGTSIGLANLNCFISAGTTSSRYFFCILGGFFFSSAMASSIQRRAALGGDANLLVVLVAGEPDAGRLVALAVQQHHVADVDRRFLLDDPAGLDLRGRPLVPLDAVDALDQH